MEARIPCYSLCSQRFTDKIFDVNPASKLNIRFKGTEAKKLLFFNSVNGHAMSIRRSFLDKILPFEKDIYYDWWAAFVASCNGGVDYLHETLVYQRVHDKNASIDKQKNRAESFLRYREQVKWHIEKFTTAPGISSDDCKLATRLFEDLSSLNKFKNKIDLLFLMLAYREHIYYYKKRIIGLFSHIKHSIKWAFF